MPSRRSGSRPRGGGSRGSSHRPQRKAPLPVGDAAAGHRHPHPAREPPAGEGAVGGAALVAGLAHLPLGGQVHQADVGRRARAPARARRSRTTPRRRSCAPPACRGRARPAPRGRSGGRRTPSRGRSRPSAPARTAAPSPRARAGRGRWPRSRACPTASASISASRSASARSGGFILSVRVERAHGLVGQEQVMGRGLGGHGGAGLPCALDRHHGLPGGHVLHVDPAAARRRPARSRAPPSWTRRPTGCRRGRAARTPRPRASRPRPTGSGPPRGARACARRAAGTGAPGAARRRSARAGRRR